MIDVSAVVAEHGAVYRAGGQGVKDITTKFFQPSTTESHFTVIPTDKTVIDKSHWTIDRVLQRFQVGFTEISTTAAAPLKIRLGHLKIDLEENPDAIEDDWHGFLASENLSRKEWPFVKWWLQQLVLQQEMEDWEQNEIYKGEEGTIVGGTPTAAGRSINGIRWQLNNVAGVNQIAMGAIPTGVGWEALFVTYVEDMIAQIPRLIRNKMDKVFMNEDYADAFKVGMRAKYNVNYMGVPEGELTRVRDTNIRVVGLPSMQGDDKIWLTPPQFRAVYAKKPNNPGFFRVEEAKRKVAVMTDYWRQPSIHFGQYTYTNDLELTTLYP